jgi:hypothetical protein
VSAGEHPVRLVVTDDLRRSRLTVFFRLLLVIPHLIWLGLWGIAAYVMGFVNWLAVLINAESPPGIHKFLAGYVRYGTHVNAYLFLAANPFPGFHGHRGYPVDVEIDDPVRQSRWSALFRLPLLLPPLVLATVVGWLGWAGGLSVSSNLNDSDTAELVTLAPSALGIAAVGVWFAALALARSPRGLRDVGDYGLGYSAQTLAYVFLLTARYPDSHPGRMLDNPSVPYHPVRLRVEDDLRRSRFTVLFRLLLAVPHIVWLTGWGVLAYLAAFVNWFVALFGGRSWTPLHRFLAAYIRYQAHVYAFLTLMANPFPGFVGKEGSYPLAIVVDGPERQRRLVTLFRLFLALPALLFYSVLAYALWVAAIGGWFASLVTGRMPSGLRALGAVIIRYGAQMSAYLLVVTDRYPNSSLALRADPPGGPEPEPELLPAHGPPSILEPFSDLPRPPAPPREDPWAPRPGSPDDPA